MRRRAAAAAAGNTLIDVVIITIVVVVVVVQEIVIITLLVSVVRRVRDAVGGPHSRLRAWLVTPRPINLLHTHTHTPVTSGHSNPT